MRIIREICMPGIKNMIIMKIAVMTMNHFYKQMKKIQGHQYLVIKVTAKSINKILALIIHTYTFHIRKEAFLE